MLVVGGHTASGSTRSVELVSLEPRSNPLPACLRSRAAYPVTTKGGGGGHVSSGI